MNAAPQPAERGRERPGVLAAVRRTVRALLERSPGFTEASPQARRDVASKLVGVAMIGADLLAEEERLRDPEEVVSSAQGEPEAGPPSAPLASAQDFGDATRAAGKTFQEIRRAIDFPTYVTSLINGVFQAITTANIQQLTAISDLLDNVAASQEEFSASNIRDRDVVMWVVQKLPFITSTDGTDLAVADDVNLDEKRSLLKSALAASDGEVAKIDSGDLMGTLGGLARRRIGQDRQQILGTLVQMGLQRIVVDEGRLHASMEMRVDTRSAAEKGRSSRNEAWLETGASANVGIGIWGASAHVNAGFSTVQSEHELSKEEIATRAGLRSSVDLAFRTEQIPLDRFASEKARVKLDANARVPMSVADGSTSLLSSDSGDKAAAAREKDAAAAEKLRKDNAERSKADEATASKKREEAAAKEKADKEKVDKEKADKEKADKEKAAKEKADKEKKPEVVPAPGGDKKKEGI